MLSKQYLSEGKKKVYKRLNSYDLIIKIETDLIGYSKVIKLRY